MKRGEIWIIKNRKTEGSEQGGRRPAVIVSNDTGNAYAPVVTVAPLTTQKKTILPCHVAISCDMDNGLLYLSTVLCEQITTVDKNRLSHKVGVVGEKEMKLINEAIKIALGV